MVRCVQLKLRVQVQYTSYLRTLVHNTLLLHPRKSTQEDLDTRSLILLPLGIILLTLRVIRRLSQHILLLSSLLRTKTRRRGQPEDMGMKKEGAHNTATQEYKQHAPMTPQRPASHSLGGTPPWDKSRVSHRSHDVPWSLTHETTPDVWYNVGHRTFVKYIA